MVGLLLGLLVLGHGHNGRLQEDVLVHEGRQGSTDAGPVPDKENCESDLKFDISLCCRSACARSRILLRIKADVRG